jgi:hypothetical protein
MFVRVLAFALLALVAAPAHAKPTKDELAALIGQTDAIAKIVSDLRGLQIKKTIPRGVLSQPEIAKRLIERLDADYAPGELVAEAKALKRMGLIPQDLDYKKEILDLLTEQIAGFYDPSVKELYIADWIETGMQRMVMAHEIDHALQDQNFDLDKFIKPDRENGDAQLARQALVEGDGVALMIEFMMRELGQKNDPWADDTIANAMAAATGMTGAAEFDKAPLFLKESLLFPYKDGLKLIAASRRTHPWTDVDAMFARPPLSTEQVMHPEKYRANEKPIVVKHGPLPSLKGWKPVYVNVLGELLFGVVLKQHGIAKETADRAAAGWGGDRFVLYENGDDEVAVDLSTWDADADALEAIDALAEALPSLARADGYTQKDPLYAACAGSDGTTSFVERKGAKVLLVVGAPAALAPKLRAEVWAKWKTGAKAANVR